MPSMPTSKICNFLGCKEKRMHGYGFCVEHGAKRSANYADNVDLYSTLAWRMIKAKIKSEQPLCVSCLHKGIVTATYAVDHVFPHRRDKERFLHNLFQGLCLECHTQKTIDENEGKYFYFVGGLQIFSEEDYFFQMAN